MSPYQERKCGYCDKSEWKKWWKKYGKLEQEGQGLCKTRNKTIGTFAVSRKLSFIITFVIGKACSFLGKKHTGAALKSEICHNGALIRQVTSVSCELFYDPGLQTKIFSSD